MMERAVIFGARRSLVGVITEPNENLENREYPNIILLNAGLLHRVGPNRTYVNLLRRLADLGITGLRFDFSGIGDSAAASDGSSELESRIQDIRDAMDLISSTTNNNRFILGGLCDGALSSFAGAIEDPRVVGMVLIDAFRYRTAGHYLRRYRKQFFNSRSWRNVLTGRHALTRRLRRDQSEWDNQPKHNLPPLSKIEDKYEELLERGVQSLEIYPGGGSFNDKSQFAEMFPTIADSSQIQVEYLADTNHTFILLRHQEILFECIEKWITEIDWSTVDRHSLDGTQNP